MPNDPPYVMPKCELGYVLWRQHPGQEPSTAIVTRVGSRSISVVIFPPNSVGMRVKDGVRHSSDPDLNRLPLQDGFWDYSPMELRVQALEEKVKLLEETQP